MQGELTWHTQFSKLGNQQTFFHPWFYQLRLAYCVIKKTQNTFIGLQKGCTTACTVQQPLWESVKKKIPFQKYIAKVSKVPLVTTANWRVCWRLIQPETLENIDRNGSAFYKGKTRQNFEKHTTRLRFITKLGRWIISTKEVIPEQRPKRD